MSTRRALIMSWNWIWNILQTVKSKYKCFIVRDHEKSIKLQGLMCSSSKSVSFFSTNIIKHLQIWAPSQKQLYNHAAELLHTITLELFWGLSSSRVKQVISEIFPQRNSYWGALEEELDSVGKRGVLGGCFMFARAIKSLWLIWAWEESLLKCFQQGNEVCFLLSTAFSRSGPV